VYHARSPANAGTSALESETLATDDKRVRGLRALLFEEQRNLLLSDEKSRLNHSFEQTADSGTQQTVYWEL
jgi:hypothetical protein